MFAARPLFSACLLALFCAPSTPSAAEDFTTIYQKWKTLEVRGEYVAALREAETLRTLCIKQYGLEHAYTARVMTELASLYVDCGKYKEGDAAGKQALALNEKLHGQKSVAAANTLLQIGRANLWLRRYSRGDECLRTSRTIYKALDEKVGVIRATRELCLLLSDEGKLKEAVAVGEESFQLAQQVLGADTVGVALSQARLGRALYVSGELQQAEQELIRSRTVLVKQLGAGHPETALVEYWLSAIYRDTGRLEQFREYVGKAANTFAAKLGPEHLLLGFVHNDYGHAAYQNGDLNEAEKQFEISVRLKKESEPEVALTLVNLANIYSKRAQYERAQPTYDRALKLAEDSVGRDGELTGFVLGNYAAMLANNKQIYEGIKLAERSLKISERYKGPAEQSALSARRNLALLYQATGQLGKSEEVFANAKQEAEKRFGSRHPVTASIIRAHGNLLRGRGQFSSAVAEIRESAAMLEAWYGKDHPDIATALLLEADCHARLSNWEEAVALTDRGVKLRNRYATSILPALSESEQLDFLASTVNASTMNAISLASRQAERQEVVDLTAEWVINTKAVRWTLLSEQARRASHQVEQRHERTELVKLRERLASLVMELPMAAEQERRAQQIADLTRQVDSLTVKLQAGDPDAARQASWRSIGDVRKSIPKDSLLVEIVCQRKTDFTLSPRSRGELWYGAWVIPPEGEAQVRFVDLGLADTINDAVEESRFSLARSAITTSLLGEQESEVQVRESLEQLADHILQPLDIESSESWIISPDASLWLVPWAALPLPNGKYAVEEHSVRHVATGRELLNQAVRQAADGGVIAADPDYDLGTQTTATTGPFNRLPGTAREAQEIAPKLQALHKKEPIVFTGEKATEDVVKRVEGVAMLLLSTHGFFFDVPPEQKLNPLLCCGLAFAGANRREPTANGNDGVLTGIEVCNMNLSGTRLVVLSACETGIGKVQQGEGVAGLRQAFQLAGAEAVLASLWPVADKETAELMSGIFDELLKGHTHTTALREAQVRFIKERRAAKQAAHPMFWAAFTLTSAVP